MIQPSFSAQCVTVHNPFHPMLGRETQLLDEPVPIRSLVPASNKPIIVVRNGRYILRADWDQPVNDGDTIAVVFLPQGGNDGGSDVTRIILTIIVLIISYYVPVVGLELAGWQAAAATAAISMEGKPLINVTFEVLK